MPIITDDFISSMPQNVAVQFLERVTRTPDREAYRYPTEAETWESVTWRETGDMVSRLAAGLLALGVESEQRVGIVSNTRYEWILADLAVMCAGAATTTVYPSTNADDTAYILSDSECQVVFAEDDSQIAKLVAQKAELPHLNKVVTFDGTPDGDWVIGLEDLAAWVRPTSPSNPAAIEDEAVLDQARPARHPDLHLGHHGPTQGRPAAAQLVGLRGCRHPSPSRSSSEDDLQFLWLPMAHSFGKVLLSTQLAVRLPDRRRRSGRQDRGEPRHRQADVHGRRAAHLREGARPDRHDAGRPRAAPRRRSSTRPSMSGSRSTSCSREGKSVPALLKLQHRVFDKLVFSKVRDRFGGRVRFFISGAAALNRDIAEWFHAAGIVILEGYGLTETSAGSFVNLPDKYKFGTVGPVFPGSEVKLGPGDEIMIKGPGVMDGYHNLPEETAKTLTEDGWLRTGDKGFIDEDGYLRITGRIKELFKTSGGKYIAPPLIESKFKAVCPYASQFMVFGNERNYCVALVTLDPDAMAEWAKENEVEGDYAAIVHSDKCRDMVAGYVDELNSQLNRWETIKKWEILDHDLTRRDR